MATGIDCLRASIGPLPPFLCQVASLFKHMLHMNTSLFMLAITISKFLYLSVYKSLPVLNDDFIATAMFRITNLISLGFSIIMLVIPGKVPLNYLICTGTFYEEWLTETPRFPLPNIVSFICMFFGLIFSAIVLSSKRKSKKLVKQASKVSKVNITNFGSFPRSWLTSLMVLVAILALGKFNRYRYIFLIFRQSMICVIFDLQCWSSKHQNLSK